MEWLTSIRSALTYIENHLRDDICVQDVGKAVFVSPLFLQKGFSMMTGYGIGEYIRNRRLYQAALDIRNTDAKIIDIAYDYAYETPESFTKAFTRFHGATPTQVRAGEAAIRSFLPVQINLTIHGGYAMNYNIRTMSGFRVIGFQKEFTYEDALNGIPKYWDEICDTYAASVWSGNAPANPQEKAVADNNIGEYGICIDDIGDNRFRYMIAGKYCGGDVPEGLTLYEFPTSEWAIFDCVGPIPGALQSLNAKIFKEWLPGNPEFELMGCANVEWYDCMHGKNTDPDYHSAIWIPVKRKQA